MIAEYLAEIAAPTEHVDDVILALDEACANVIRHAFPEDGDATFRLVADISDDQVSMAVEDDGVGFDPEEIDLREDDGTSGRGLKIIRKVMSSVEVCSPLENGGGTRLLMQKRLRETV